MQIQFRSLDSLIEYSRNTRTHDANQIEKLAAAIDEYGWTNPVLADGLSVVAGHGRLAAARKLYAAGRLIKLPNGSAVPEGSIPVIDCSGWSDTKRKAYIIWDNRSAEMAGWDLDLLKLELDDLKLEGFDLDSIGFDADSLNKMFPDIDVQDNGKDPDDAPPLPETPHSKTGDVWALGPHRIICGDSTDVAVWDKLMSGEQADACWTDPPYNIDIGGKNAALDRADKGNRGKTGSIMNDKMGDKEFYSFLLAMYSAVLAQLKPGAPIYVAHADSEGLNFRKAFLDAGFKLQSILIWNKNIHVLGRWDYQPKHEPIIYGWKPGSAHRWYGGRKLTTVMEMGDGSPFARMDDGRYQIKVGDSVLVLAGDVQVEESPSTVIYEPKPAKSGLHPTMKPVALVERMLKSSARPGDVVVEPFGGSGTTLIAAERLGMCARVVEMDAKYVDVICRRYFDYCGRKPVNSETGEEFPL